LTQQGEGTETQGSTAFVSRAPDTFGGLGRSGTNGWLYDNLFVLYLLSYIESLSPRAHLSPLNDLDGSPLGSVTQAQPAS